MSNRDWLRSDLGSFAALSLRRVDPADRPELPYIGLEHIGQNTLTLLSEGRAGDVTGSSLLADAGDILFGKLRPYFRKVIRVRRTTLCTPEAWVVRAGPGVDPGFLFYVMADPAFIDACSQSAEGTRMPRANWTLAARYPVLLPRRAEQERISAVLGALDEKIEVNRQMSRTLGALAALTFKARFLVNPPQRLPSGWTVGSIGDLADVVHDTVDPADVSGTTPYVGLEHVPRRSPTLDAWGTASETTSPKTRFERGDALFGRLRPYFHKVVPAPMAGVASTDILVIRPRSEEWRWFVFGHLSSDPMVAHATAASAGTKMPRTRWADLCRHRIGLPDSVSAADFHAAVDPLYQRIWANTLESRTLATLRDTLLPKLISGELRVPDAESIADENAQAGPRAQG